MSRFHDEFFRQGSPDHDALMIKCTSEEGIKKIISSIDLEKYVFEATIDLTSDWGKEVTVCTLKDDKNVAWRGTQKSWSPNRDLPLIREEYKTDASCILMERCKHAVDCDLRIKENWPKPKKIKFGFDYEGVRSKSFETEVIAKNGNFIMGYADAIIKLTFEGSVKAIIREDWIWENYDIYKVDVDILVEAKPKLISIGDVIRQIKTYKYILKRQLEYNVPMIPVITTYTKMERDALDYLANEGIYLVQF